VKYESPKAAPPAATPNANHIKVPAILPAPGADEGDVYELRELRKSEEEAKALAELVRPKTWDEIHEEQDRERDED
jgi:hypothetical protein